jgi:hypothetical protein
MCLTQENTQWIFLLASPGEPDERHIYDVAYGIYCLEARGINPTDIAIFVDGANRNRIETIIANASTYKYQIRFSTELFPSLSTNTYDNVVLFVTGHGDVEGIAAPTPIKPFVLIESIRNAPSLRQGVIYLGQCFAGIFNYMWVGKEEDDEGNQIKPPLVVIGATSLFNSISLEIEQQLLTTTKRWSANVFLACLFIWLQNPVDVDGDGRYTIMDSFKFAGTWANNANTKVKIANFGVPDKLQVEIDELKKLIDNHATKNPADQSFADLILRHQTKCSEYENALTIRFTHQESWVLNSLVAQDIEY